MLKKAGIIAAVATAGVLALTPFAFANNDTTPDHGSEQINACEFTQDIDNESTIALAPTSTQSQNDNCVNVGDGSAVNPETEEDGEDTAGILDALGDLLGDLL